MGVRFKQWRFDSKLLAHSSDVSTPQEYKEIIFISHRMSRTWICFWFLNPHLYISYELNCGSILSVFNPQTILPLFKGE